MKRSLSLLAGMVLVFAVGAVYADDVMPSDSDDKIFREEDLLKYNLDQNQSTVSQMPAKPEAGGSAAGGSGDPILKDDSAEKLGPAPEESITPAPYDRGRGMDDPYKDIEKRDQDIYRY